MLGSSLADILLYPPSLGLQCTKQALHSVANTPKYTAKAVLQMYPEFRVGAASLQSDLLHGKRVRLVNGPEFVYFDLSAGRCAE